jgi:hypothetical protein
VRGHPAQSAPLFEGHDDSGGVGFREAKPLMQKRHELLPAHVPAGGDAWPVVGHESLSRFSEINRIDHESLLCPMLGW